MRKLSRPRVHEHRNARHTCLRHMNRQTCPKNKIFFALSPSKCDVPCLSLLLKMSRTSSYFRGTAHPPDMTVGLPPCLQIGIACKIDRHHHIFQYYTIALHVPLCEGPRWLVLFECPRSQSLDPSVPSSGPKNIELGLAFEISSLFALQTT